MSNNHYCGECLWMTDEGSDGYGFCGQILANRDDLACKDFAPCDTCGDCLLFETEDGSPYCLAKGPHTFAYVGDPTCEDFIEKDENNEN
jgi:hypothetical protein